MFTAAVFRFSGKRHRPAALWIILLILSIFTCRVNAQSEVEEVVIEVEQTSDEAISDLVSVSALDAEKLADAGIENVEDVAAYVPNLVLTETETGTSIVIRGLGAGVNQGFDQSVGLYSDRVPLPRANMARSPFLDLSNVQVLRGAQYVLDGSYSIAGSVHMFSNLDVEEFEAEMDLNYIPSQNDRKLMLAAGGPITDTFAARLVVQSKLSDGYLENVFKNDTDTQRDDLIARLVLGYQPTDALSFKLKVEQGNFKTRGRNFEVLLDQPTPDPGISASAIPTLSLPNPPTLTRTAADTPFGERKVATPWEVAADRRLRPLRIAYDAAALSLSNGIPTRRFAYAGKSYTEAIAEQYPTSIALPDGLFDTTADFKRATDADEYGENKTTNITLNADLWLGEYQLLGTLSNIDYTFDEVFDSDFTPVPMLLTTQREEYEQSFARLEIKSPSDGFFQWQAGADFLDSKLDFNDRTALQLTERDGLPGAGAFVEDFRFLDSNGENPDPFRAWFGQTSAGNIALVLDEWATDLQFKQDTTITSAFFQSKFQWTERFATELGFRYTHAEKDAVRDLAVVDRVDGTPISGDTSATTRNRIFASLARFFGIQSHTDRYPTDIVLSGDGRPARKGSRREEKFLPSFKAELTLTPDLSVYAGVSLANKLGGFDARSNATDQVVAGIGLAVGTFEFEDEDATSYELGGKWYIPNGYGELNAALFYTEYRNLQLSRFDGRVGFNVDNAGAATSKGIEIDGLLNLTDRLSMEYSLAWIDFSFDDFKKGSCHLGEEPDFYFVGAELTRPTSTLAGDLVQQGDFIPVVYDIFRQSLDGFQVRAANNIRWGDINGALVADSEGVDAFDNADTLGSPAFCDFSGKSVQYVSEWTGRWSINYTTELIGLGLLKPTLDILYNSGYHTSVSQDPLVAQDKYFQLNGRLEIASYEDTWAVALVGENLTNEVIVTYANDMPLGARIQGARGFVGSVRSPRAIGINIQYKIY